MLKTLLKKRIIQVAMLAIVIASLCAVGAGTAHADDPSGLTCGQSAPHLGKGVIVSDSNDYFQHYNDGSSEWDVRFDQYCGTGGTVAVEFQVSDNGTSGWSDVNEGIFSAVDGDPHTREHVFTGGGCSTSKWYRVQGWANAAAGDTPHDVTGPVPGSNFC